MRALSRTCRLLAVGVAMMPLARAQPAGSVSGEPALRQVVVLGASVSGGFTDGRLAGGTNENRTTPLATILRGWLEGTGAEVTARADQAMFKDPDGRALPQIERTVRDGPDVVVAVDFLFWFAYGAARGDEAAVRRQHLRVGLDLLDRLQCPIVVGDLPDMHGAAARMLSARQIPSAEVLAQLNDALHEWAAERPRVRVVPVCEMVAEMKDRGVTLPLAAGELAVPPGGLLQGDRLHATRLGMAWLGYRLQDHVRAVLPPEVVKAVPRRSLEEFLAIADAQDDVAWFHELAGAKAASPGSGDPKSGAGVPSGR